MISSSSHVQGALRLLADEQARLEQLLAAPEIVKTQEEIALLKKAIDEYILENDNYEDDDWKLTRVQGVRRRWDVAVLERVLPRGVFKNVIKIEADPAKIDQYVREKKIELRKIAPALVEEPNAPYVKMTKKSHNEARGAAEAAELAEAMG